MLIENSAKPFELPPADQATFLATVVDVVDLGKVKSKFGEKVKIRIIWALNANDSEGNPYRVMRQVNATINEKSALYEIAKGVLGTAPPVPFDSENLIGRSNQLVVVREKDSQTGKEYANVKAILPLPAGAVPPPIPQGFVRSKDRPANTFTNGALAVAQAPAPAAANTVANTATAGGTAAPQPATTPSVDAAF